MKYLKQFFIIIFISFVGEIFHELIPMPIPAGIYGILILFFGLLFGIIPLDSVKDAGKFLIEIMPVMFIPAAVGLIDSWDILQSRWVVYLFIAFITTVVVMGVTGVVTQKIIRMGKEKKK